MTSYVDQAVTNIRGLSDITIDTLKTIEFLDVLSQRLANKLDKEVAGVGKSGDTSKLRKIALMRQALEDLSEKKSQLSLRNYDLVDQNIQIVDKEIKVLETAMKLHGTALVAAEAAPSPKAGRKRGRAAANSKSAEEALAPTSFDPNEPVYCTCRRVAFGNMVACDNEECPIEWFHCSCVNLVKVPKNEWLCPICSQKKKKNG